MRATPASNNAHFSIEDIKVAVGCIVRMERESQQPGLVMILINQTGQIQENFVRRVAQIRKNANPSSLLDHKQPIHFAGRGSNGQPRLLLNVRVGIGPWQTSGLCVLQAMSCKESEETRSNIE